MACSHESGNATKTLAPAAAPIAEPTTKGSTVPRRTYRHMIMVRDMPVPSITTVWTGITTVGGIPVAMIASRITPPAAPVNTAMNAVTNEAADRPTNKSGPTSGAARMSIPLRLLWRNSASVEAAVEPDLPKSLHTGDRLHTIL